ncbi:hypothetical protein D3C74_206470 [compost metagenome]
MTLFMACFNTFTSMRPVNFTIAIIVEVVRFGYSNSVYQIRCWGCVNGNNRTLLFFIVSPLDIFLIEPLRYAQPRQTLRSCVPLAYLTTPAWGAEPSHNELIPLVIRIPPPLLNHQNCQLARFILSGRVYAI